MTLHLVDRVRAWVRLSYLSGRLVAGRRFYLAPLVPLLWCGLSAFFLLVGWRGESFAPEDAQNGLIGLPLTLLAIGFGVRIVAGDIDRRMLEVAYTVPGGAHRSWLAKLAAAAAILIVAALALGLVSYLFFTAFPWWALLAALQPAAFYLALSMALATFLRSEVTGALVTTPILLFNGLITGFGDNQLVISPFWNPAVLHDLDPAELAAKAVQNRLGFLLATAGLVVLAFARAERREKMLGS